MKREETTTESPYKGPFRSLSRVKNVPPKSGKNLLGMGVTTWGIFLGACISIPLYMAGAQACGVNPLVVLWIGAIATAFTAMGAWWHMQFEWDYQMIWNTYTFLTAFGFSFLLGLTLGVTFPGIVFDHLACKVFGRAQWESCVFAGDEKVLSNPQSQDKTVASAGQT